MPVSEYREVIRQRQSPLSVRQPRNDETISVVILLPDIAVTKVRLRNHEHTVDLARDLKMQAEASVVGAVALSVNLG
jgi:hypothetical protein